MVLDSDMVHVVCMQMITVKVVVSLMSELNTYDKRYIPVTKT